MSRLRLALGILGLAGLGLYRSRRYLIGRWLGLPAPRYRVGVERDVPVPMPDGAVLLADHYAPSANGSFPTILVRTPYGRTGPSRPVNDFFYPCFAERGYHVVLQETRGPFVGKGSVEPFVHEAADGRATVDWLAARPWFNGILGMWGPSYLGYVQWAVAGEAPPSLRALVPVVGSSQLHSVFHPDGSFALLTTLRWLHSVSLIASMHRMSAAAMIWQVLCQERILARALQHLPVGEADTLIAGEPVPFYRTLVTQRRPDDPFWAAADHSRAVGRVALPAHLIGGWYDLFLRELLADYAALQAAGQLPFLTIGPWAHSQSNVQLLQVAVGEGLAWFDAHLKGEAARLRRHPVRLYVMGADEWREIDHWPPPARPTRYSLHRAGHLSTAAAEADAPPDRYRYDPADPTPTVGGTFLLTGAGPKDNRVLEARRDVLCYTTPPLAAPVEVVGPVRLALYVRSSLAHTDFAGRLCDVHPDGRSINLCDGLFRVEPGRGEPQPDGSLRIEIDLWATANRFQPGHRIRLQVASGSHPRWSRNLGTGEPLATGTTMVAAEQTVYHDATHPSALVLPVTSRP
ncbi:MAG: CocE/NonD family hydrolase [Chloroflexi bacterium]|nr:CocE/NonD family hydrolase [Chloroflexota bacterium]